MPQNTGYLTHAEGVANLAPRDISLDSKFITQFVPLFYELALRNRVPAITHKFAWPEGDLQGESTTINFGGGYSAGSTVLTVTDCTIFQPKDRFRILRTGENCRVLSRNTGANTITVTRHIGAGAGFAINNADVLLNLGNAMEDASTPPAENYGPIIEAYNYLEIKRKTFAMAGSLLRGDPDPMASYGELAQKALESIYRDIEYSMFFGKRNLDTTTYSHNMYEMNGIVNIISTNITPVGGTLSEDAWNIFLADKVFKYGATEKIMFCGQNYQKCLSKWARGQWITNRTIDTPLRSGVSGVNISQYISPTGEILYVYTHQLFRRQADLAGLAVIIDPNEIKLRYMGTNTQSPPVESAPGLLYPNGNLQIGEGIQIPGTDGVLAEYFCQIGLEARNEAMHSMMTGVTGPA